MVGRGIPARSTGDDIWLATLGTAAAAPALSVVRLASLTDRDAEPAGFICDKSGTPLLVNVQHRGGDGLNITVAISRTPGNQLTDEHSGLKASPASAVIAVAEKEWGGARLVHSGALRPPHV